jgi:hypothetical protein
MTELKKPSAFSDEPETPETKELREQQRRNFEEKCIVDTRWIALFCAILAMLIVAVPFHFIFKYLLSKGILH